MDTLLSPGTEIPDGEILYRYYNPIIFPDDQEEIPMGVFNDPEMSCDWAKYVMDPYSSFHIKEGRTGIIAITINDDIRNPKNPRRAGQVVPAWHQEIIYDPVSTIDEHGHQPNLAHSLIKGPKKAAVVEALRCASVIMTATQLTI